MKKGIFLFFSVMLLSSMSAFAQWTLPEVKTSDLVVGEVMYLYNKDACAFFRGLGEDGDGIYWGTRAGVAVNGADSIKILPALAVNVPENTRSSSNYDIPWLEEDDGETYLVQVWSSHRQKRWDELWFGCWALDQIWVDRANEINGNVNFFWNVKLTETGSYTISVSEKSTCFNNEEIESVLTGGEKLGVDLSSANLVTCLEGYNNGAELSYDWYFVKKSDYESVDLDYLSRYKAAMVLKELIEESKVTYPSLDFSVAEAVYNNTSSTLEELQTAKKLVNQAIMDSKDCTHYIVNAGFDEDLTFNSDGSYKEGTVPNSEKETLSNRSWSYVNPDGSCFAHSDSRSVNWNGSDGRAWATNGYVAAIKGWECTKTDYPACEWVYFGVLPYDLELNAIPLTDNGTSYQTVPDRPNNDYWEDNKGALFFRAGWGGQCSYKQNIKLPNARYRLEYWTINNNINSTEIPVDLTNVTCNGVAYKDKSGNELSSTEWTKHYIDFIAFSDITIEFGYKSTISGSAAQAYVFIDDVKLYKIDDDILTEKVKTIEIDFVRDLNKGYTLDSIDVDMDSICGLLGISSISEATVWGVNATTFEFVEDAMNKYDGWRNSDGDFTAWGNGHHICYKYMENGKFELCTASDNEPGIGSSYSLYWAFTTDSDTVLLKTNVRLPGTDEDPLDMTSYISNANYASVDGWLGDTPTLGSGNAEFFAKVFNSFQTITGLPNGIYKLSVQGFYRAGSKEDAYLAYAEGNDEVLKTLLYARTSDAFYSKPLCSIMDSKAENVLYSSGEEYLMGNGKYIPNTMASSAAYFTAGHYNGNSLYLKVTDGTLTIGLANTDYVANAWSMFGNWTLTYYGANSKHVPVETEDVVNALLNAAVTRSDVELTFKNDKIYPWSIETEGLKNGNCGVSNSSSSISFSYNSSYRTEVSFDWRSYDYYSSHQPLQVYIDGVLKTSYSSSSFANKRFYLDAGEHIITFKDSIGNSSSTSNYSYIKNISVKNILPLETVVLGENSQPLTFVNDDKFPWTIEDGYIQNSNYGTANSVAEFSTTFTVDKTSKFSFDQWVNRYDENTKDASSYHGFSIYINGTHYNTQYYTSGWQKKCVALEPGQYTIVFKDHIYNTTTSYYSRVDNIELSSNWVEVELASAGTLGVEVLYKVNVLTDVELLKVKGTLNATDWTNIKQMTNLLALDLSEAKFDAVPEYAFDGLSWLSNVKLPEGMTSIGQYAFRGTQIWNIDIPSTVTYIGQYAFASTRLRSIDFPEDSQLRTIGYRAFYNCTSLQEFIMPNTVTTLQRYNNSSNISEEAETFYGCTSLRKLHFSDALSEINAYVCYDCTKLVDLHLPKNLKYIYYRAFYNNRALVKVDFPESLTSIASYSFSTCALDSVKLPVKLSSLDYRAFEHCDNLRYIELPSYISSYNENFYDCSAIEKIVCQSATPPAITSDPFSNARSKGSITLVVPSFAVVNYKLDTYWYQFGSIVEGDDIDYWKITSALSLTNNRRMNGKPDVDLYYGGQFTVGGNAPMEVGQLNYFVSESNPGRLLNTCGAFTTDSINTYYSVDANKWYFFTPIHDVDLSKVTHSATSSFVFRYYDGESRATNGTGNSWRNVDSGKLIAGQGYIFQCNSSGVVTMPAETAGHTQMLNTADVEIPLVSHEAPASANKSWNYVGNPYPTYYDVYYMDFTAPITVWTGSTYKAYSIVDDNLVLRPMQSFFVQKPDAIDNVIFHKEGRQLTSAIERSSYSRTRNVVNNNPRFFFNLQITSEDDLTDETRVVINNNAELVHEIQVDASKFISMEKKVPQIFTIDNEGNNYAINERPYDNGTVSLGYRAEIPGFYYICATSLDGEALLVDHKMNKVVDLSEQDYMFYSDATEGHDLSRFTLKLSVSDEGATNIEDSDITKASIISGGNGVLQIESALGMTYSVYTVDGRIVEKGVIESESYVLSIPAGTYIVKVNNSTFKTIVF